MTKWTYAESLGHARIQKLLAETSFWDIAGRVRGEMSLLCFHLQPCDDLCGFVRPVFCARIGGDLFDSFFNSPVGYRGQFYISADAGIDANQHLIGTLAPSMIQWAQVNAPGHDASFSLAGLTAHSAKVWLAEQTLELCEKCKGEWSHPQDDTPEIINDRWERADSSNAKKGRKAPRHSKLRIFGAFLSGYGDEFIPARKRRRAFDIHDAGWA
jgi:hypothetical protein